MKLELGLSNLQDDHRTNHPVVRVVATVEEGDLVTTGSQFMQEFALESLGNFLGEVRDDQSRGVEADGVQAEEAESKDANELSDELNPETHKDVEDGDPLSREQQNELNKEDKAEEDKRAAEASAAAANGPDRRGDEPVATAADLSDTSDGSSAVVENKPKRKSSKK